METVVSNLRLNTDRNVITFIPNVESNKYDVAEILKNIAIRLIFLVMFSVARYSPAISANCLRVTLYKGLHFLEDSA